MAKRTKILSKSRLLKVEALEARQLLADDTVAVAADPREWHRGARAVAVVSTGVVSFLDVHGDSVEAQFSGLNYDSAAATTIHDKVAIPEFTAPARRIHGKHNGRRNGGAFGKCKR